MHVYGRERTTRHFSSPLPRSFRLLVVSFLADTVPENRKKGGHKVCIFHVNRMSRRELPRTAQYGWGNMVEMRVVCLVGVPYFIGNCRVDNNLFWYKIVPGVSRLHLDLLPPASVRTNNTEMNQGLG